MAYEIVVYLTGVTNGQVVTVELVVNAGTRTLRFSVPVGFVLGDVNNSGLVNSTDVSNVQGQSGQVVTGSNFRCDVNCNGLIGSSDISTVQSRSGTGIPP